MSGAEIKVGDVVTVELGQEGRENSASNTFIVARKLEGESVLHHPLAPSVFLVKPDETLNKTMAQLKNSEERQLEYCTAQAKLLGHDARSMLDALCMYFVVFRRFSARQRKILSDLCGEIASEYCNYDVTVAIRIVNENQALLDSHNQIWYQNLYRIFSGKKPPNGVGIRSTVFNMAGFVLAQIQESRVPMRYNQGTSL